jgi:hypothetical protein
VGVFIKVIATTIKAMAPPKKIEGMVPIKEAAKPLSSRPSSLDELEKTELIDITRPRI